MKALIALTVLAGLAWAAPAAAIAPPPQPTLVPSAGINCYYRLVHRGHKWFLDLYDCTTVTTWQR